MSETLEIERKYLVSELPPLDSLPHFHLRQGYIATGDTEVRLRTEGQRIEKTRYQINYGEHLIELDVYHGALEPLASAEVEFNSEAASASFEAPNYFGDDVTEDKSYKNKNLAMKGLPS